jgi:hypothetical protein
MESVDLKDKPSLLRKYIYEYALLTLASCVAFLFYAYADLNADFRTYLLQDRSDMVKAIERNNQVIHEFNTIQKSKGQ